MQQINTLAAPVGRSLLAAIFIISGIGKISAYAGTQAYMEAMGVPGALLPLVIAAEVLGGIAVAAGLFTRLAAAGLAVFSVMTAVMFHGNIGEQAEFISFMKNLAIAGGFILLAVNGAGAVSIDQWRNRDAAGAARG